MTVPKALQAAFKNAPWLIPELAPKDKPFIGVFKGYPYPSQAHWNDASKKWVYVTLQAECYMQDGKYDDVYFENVYVDKEDLIAWIPTEEWK